MPMTFINPDIFIKSDFCFKRLRVCTIKIIKMLKLKIKTETFSASERFKVWKKFMIAFDFNPV